MTLTPRVLAYLERHKDEWVPKHVLSMKARKAGFTYHQIRAVFDEVEQTINVGIRSDNGMHYRWYDMTEEERRATQEDIEWFDSLPDRATLSDSGMAPSTLIDVHNPQRP